MLYMASEYRANSAISFPCHWKIAHLAQSYFSCRQKITLFVRSCCLYRWKIAQLPGSWFPCRRYITRSCFPCSHMITELPRLCFLCRWNIVQVLRSFFRAIRRSQISSSPQTDIEQWPSPSRLAIGILSKLHKQSDAERTEG